MSLIYVYCNNMGIVEGTKKETDLAHTTWQIMQPQVECTTEQTELHNGPALQADLVDTKLLSELLDIQLQSDLVDKTLL